MQCAAIASTFQWRANWPHSPRRGTY